MKDFFFISLIVFIIPIAIVAVLIFLILLALEAVVISTFLHEGISLKHILFFALSILGACQLYTLFIINAQCNKLFEKIDAIEREI